MQLKTTQRIELPATADMHVHLRQGDMMNLVVPTVRQGGVDTVFVMPNLAPPLTAVDKVLEYKAQLEALEKNVHFQMSLFLHPLVTPDVIDQAAAAGITGVKLYPQGVTTNSENGVADITAFYPTFAAMEKHDIVLNIHGEVLEALAPEGLSLEEAFLPTLKTLHEQFPNLRIILEHCTTSAAVEAVRACGPNVGATITAHHLYLTHHEACCDPFAFCKPIPKKPTDRDALVKAAVSGETKFFFGSDSAPHPLESKTTAEQGKTPAGVFTQPYVTQLVLLALEEAVERGVITDDDITQEKLEGFLSRNGRRFYKLPETAPGKIVLERKGEKIATSIKSETVEVGNSRGGDEVFTLTWV
ncbi:Putative Dihydroorotase, homodimeric type [[Torrubiella] hemipterigena]|uniref:dihydroorotase n=1 Tax=[Torrubiella] hemipterigena TaxID=1531966 RepID=A0A0A1TK05_9HYPO|nr:Putative Dihydroorotase, homodimeric type [[Torrubiella] hemipterigena]